MLVSFGFVELHTYFYRAICRTLYPHDTIAWKTQFKLLSLPLPNMFSLVLLVAHFSYQSAKSILLFSAAVLSLSFPAGARTETRIVCYTGDQQLQDLNMVTRKDCDKRGWNNELLEAQNSILANELFALLSHEALRWTGTGPVTVEPDRLHIRNVVFQRVRKIENTEENASSVEARTPISSTSRIASLAMQSQLRALHRSMTGKGAKAAPMGSGVLESTVKLFTVEETRRRAAECIDRVARDIRRNCPLTRVSAHWGDDGSGYLTEPFPKSTFISLSRD